MIMILTRREMVSGLVGAALGLGGSRLARAAAQGGWRAPSGDWLETHSPGRFPAYLKNAGPKAWEMYRFAAANGEMLRYIPCYCGCGSERVGHKSNADCYVAERFPDGRITFSSHAAG
jgi:hypothetical protein